MSTMRNSVMLVGRPDSEPEMETLSNNQKVARFRIGVNEPYINANNERVDNTYWFNVVALNSFADKVMEVVSKGKLIAVEGSLRNKEWTDDNGSHLCVTEILVCDLFPIETERKEK